LGIFTQASHDLEWPLVVSGDSYAFSVDFHHLGDDLERNLTTFQDDLDSILTTFPDDSGSILTTFPDDLESTF
jgi:hypothetical protein